MQWLLVAEWLLALFVLTAVGAPLAAWLFPTFPRKGAAFALPVSLLAVALVVFWIGQVTYGLHAVLGAIFVVAGLSGLALVRGVRPDWRAVSGGFGVFAVGFLVLVVFRASDPTIIPQAGEKFLHFGLTKALWRAPALPPEDFWFAGEPLRYYYGTQLQVTSLSMLTGTPLRFGYNLAHPVFYGVLFVSAYGLVGAVVESADYSRRLGGLLGAFFVAVGGASTTALRLLVGQLPEDLATTVGQPVFGFAASRYGIPLAEFIAQQGSLDGWSWWYTRYVVPGTLQEFPFYALIKGDLHGHALSTGYVVLAAALAYSYYRLPAERRRRRLAVLLGGLGVVAGVFGFMNTWSLPTAVGLAWLAVAAADAHPATLFPDGVAKRLRGPDASPDSGWGARLGSECWRLVLAVVPAIVVGVLGVVLASPFLVFGHVPTNEGVGLFPPRSPLLPFLVIYGAILILIATFLLVRSRPALGRAPTWLVAVGAALCLDLALFVWLPYEFPVLAVVGPLLLAFWWLVRTDRMGFAGVLAVGGLGLLLAIELVFAKVAPWPEGPPRWNTAYKVSIQAWVLLGLAAGAMAAVLLSDAREAVAEWRADTGGLETTSRRWPTVLAGVLVVGVLVLSSPFPVMAAATEVGDHLQAGNDLYLDGLENHERARPGEMAAINWLDEREGRPTIVEAPGRAVYSWTNPASSLTGIPTVVGWLRAHEENYRPQDRIDRRVAAVDAVYSGPWAEAVDTLRTYDVEYVYVGPVERERYGSLGERFDERQGLSVAFESDAVTIYRVSAGELPTG